jgi:lipopolysaccharide/colanic/teichoic acid biosynthesis glycosyltransferase
VGLGLLLAPMALVALVIWVANGPPVLHREYRVGRHGVLFPQYKFRTLQPRSGTASSVAPEDDLRITNVGLCLRRWRLDEFPQLFNILLGQMSLVGPRPMPPGHAGTLPRKQLDILLSVRPGLTDEAALHFLAEDAVLAGRPDAQQLYLQRLLPAKVRMQIDALQQRSLAGDLRTVARTLAQLWSPRARVESATAMRKLLDTEAA